MSNQITTAHVKMYKDYVYEVAQQGMSKLSAHVEPKSEKGKTVFFDAIGQVEMSEVTNRRQPTVLSDTPHTRRGVTMKSFQWADTVDEEDLLKVLIDPKSAYVKNAAKAWGRKQDQLIISAFDASVISGENGDSTTAWDTNQDVTAGSGLTFAKLTEGLTLLESNDVDIETEPPILVLSPKCLDKLRTEEKATSRDYNDFGVLQNATLNGKIGPLGLRYIVSTLLPIASGVRNCFLYSKSCMYFNVPADLSVSVDRRPDMNNLWQILVKGSANALRMEEKAVIRFKVTE